MARTPIHPGEVLADELDLARKQLGKTIQRIPKRSRAFISSTQPASSFPP
jgi:plasmid maintenance system antidote protein VapI